MRSALSVVLKNFINRPVTRLYPKSDREPFERTRGRIYFVDDNCIYCGICQRKCPADAIKVDRPGTTWELDAFRCIICGECVSSCPKKCISLQNNRRHSSTEKKYLKITKLTNTPQVKKPSEASKG